MMIPPAIGIIGAPVMKNSQVKSVKMLLSKVKVSPSEKSVAKVAKSTQSDSAFYMP